MPRGWRSRSSLVLGTTCSVTEADFLVMGGAGYRERRGSGKQEVGHITVGPEALQCWGFGPADDGEPSRKAGTPEVGPSSVWFWLTHGRVCDRSKVGCRQESWVLGPVMGLPWWSRQGRMRTLRLHSRVESSGLGDKRMSTRGGDGNRVLRSAWQAAEMTHFSEKGTLSQEV